MEVTEGKGGKELNFEMIILQKEDGVATIILNRPKGLNALNSECFKELVIAIEDVRDDEEVKALVLTGAGDTFSAGGDIKEMQSLSSFTPMEFRDFLRDANRAVLGLRNLPKPVIAAANGIALGAGCNLALACDIVLASEKARFGEVFVGVGLVPDTGGTYLLPRLVGTI